MREWRGVWLVGGWQATASRCFSVVFAATAFVREGFGLSRFLTGLAVAAVMVGYTLALFGAGATAGLAGATLAGM